MSFNLFADAKPSETIKKQQNHPSGLAVACILPHKNDEQLLDVPIKQFKDYNTKVKANRAKTLTEWLRDQRSSGLQIPGFLISRSLRAAARYGLDLLEELPNTHVEQHYNSYRLYFGDEAIDFPHAVALMYYYFPIAHGCLRAWKMIDEKDRNLTVFLDRFPSVNSGVSQVGDRPSKTQGFKFIEFIRNNSVTAIEIDKADAESNAFCKYDNLVWWRKTPESDWIEGKKHPNFTLVDWLVSAALANSFRDEYVQEYPNRKKAAETIDALIELYQEFKKFNIWEIADDETLDHIVSNEKHWEIPKEARTYIYENIQAK